MASVPTAVRGYSLINMEGVKLNVESGSNALQDEPLDEFHNKM